MTPNGTQLKNTEQEQSRKIQKPPFTIHNNLNKVSRIL